MVMRRVLDRAPIVLAGLKYLIKRAIWYHVYVQPEMTILLSITKLRRALLSRGDVCLRTVEMLALAQDGVAREEIPWSRVHPVRDQKSEYSSGFELPRLLSVASIC